MEQMAYSFHLSSDKNRKTISKSNSKNNISGTSSLSNNAIQNARQLTKVDKHNYRKYDNNQELIEIVRGTTSPYNDIKNLYINEFEEARLEYNSKQKRNDRKIENYFENISNNEKKDLACEIIIELGDKTFWDTKDNNYKKKMSNFRSDLKIIVIGTSGTGKTSFVNKWTKNQFSDTYKATIVSEFGFKIFENEGKLYRIQLWDLAGQDKNAMVTKIFAKDAHGCVVMSDATNIQTREE